MRPGAEYPMSHGPASTTSPAPPRSPWQSPVPYLFGGLAAMLGLIALSLLALACSYWKLAGSSDDGQAGGGAESRADGEKCPSGAAASSGEWRGSHVVVIMAGDERPTFLAKPATSSRAADHAVEPAADVASSSTAAGSEEEATAKAAECEASTQPAGSEDGAHLQSRGEQNQQ